MLANMGTYQKTLSLDRSGKVEFLRKFAGKSEMDRIRNTEIR